MESKRDKSLRLLTVNDGLILCPVCKETLHANDDYTMTCTNGHSFDISKKGILNLVGKSNDKLYDNTLFLNRRQVINNGNYDPLITRISELLHKYVTASTNHLRIIDAGCGEGSFFNAICQVNDNETSNGKAKETNSHVGIDLSREGINLASDHGSDIIWLIDDLANIHIKDRAFDVLLNILSPANYSQFKRVLDNDGIIIKVVPGKDYLREIRNVLRYDQDTYNTNGIYDNTKTMEHTMKEMSIIHNEKMNYHLDIPADEFDRFIKMTPLTHGKDALMPLGKHTLATPSKKIYGLTIDLEILVGRPF